MAPDASPPQGDRGGAGVRFGCGALVGLIVGASAAVGDVRAAVLVASALACALLFGALSARYGERFWERLPRWLG